MLRFFLTLVAFCFLCLIGQARPPQAPPAMRLAQAPPPMICDCSPCICGNVCACPSCLDNHNYSTAYKKSKSSGCPLILFINCKARKIEGCESCKVSEMNGRKGPCILVTCNQEIKGEFPATATTEQLLRSAFRVTMMAPPPMMMAPPPPMMMAMNCST